MGGVECGGHGNAAPPLRGDLPRPHRRQESRRSAEMTSVTSKLISGAGDATSSDALSRTIQSPSHLASEPLIPFSPTDFQGLSEEEVSKARAEASPLPAVRRVCLECSPCRPTIAW